MEYTFFEKVILQCFTLLLGKTAFKNNNNIASDLYARVAKRNMWYEIYFLDKWSYLNQSLSKYIWNYIMLTFLFTFVHTWIKYVKANWMVCISSTLYSCLANNINIGHLSNNLCLFAPEFRSKQHRSLLIQKMFNCPQVPLSKRVSTSLVAKYEKHVGIVGLVDCTGMGLWWGLT